MHAGETVAQRYKIERPLGEGGLGVVYEATHLATGQRLALKVLVAAADDAMASARRFEREAKAVALLDHPNIIEVLDFGLLGDGRRYLAMELVRGVSLGELLDRRAVGPRRALVIARQVLDALEYAHERGFIHRDLKPDNIMIARAGSPGAERDHVKLLDFGLVKLVGDAADELGGEKLTQTGVVFGTPSYMAPEQALGRPVGPWTDLYALGLVLHEALAGRPAFGGPDQMAILRQQVTAPPPRLPDAPWRTPAIEALVARATDKRAELRYRTAAEMRAALDEAFVSIDFLPPE